MYFTVEEKREILEIYIHCHKNKSEARREYMWRHPNQAAPARNTFRSVYDRFVRNNSLSNASRQRFRTVITEEMELNILLFFTDDPGLSTYAASRHFNVSKTSVLRVLKKYHYKPYHVMPLQKLSENDKENRQLFCQSLLDRIRDDEEFFENIFWTDESSFSTGGVFNRKNTHRWTPENTHAIKEIKKQGHLTVNVWCGIHQNRIVGPFFIEGTLTGDKYLNILEESVEAYVDGIPLNERFRIIWQQDGAPPHNTRNVVNYLNQTYPLWIGRNAPLRWPARSPDLTPMDFSIWGIIKQKVYGDGLYDNAEQLKYRISEQIDLINANPGIFTRIRTNFIKRCNICIQNNGGSIENLL